MNMNLDRLTCLVADCSRESDDELLAAYISGHQPAFRELVDRHGSVVFGVCQRVLRHRQDAEDAFQAVFLVLARRAADVWPRDAVGSWLYGVAYRIALKARSLRSRHRCKEHPLQDVAQRCEPSLGPDVAEVVVRAIRGLPEVYRAAVLACDLQGLSRKDAAMQLNWSEGTLSSRLARARQLLAKRLLKTGVALPAAGLATLFGTMPPVRAGLPGTVMRIISSTGGVPAPIATLTQGLAPGMFAFKVKVVAVALLMTVTLSYGAYCSSFGDDPAAQATPVQFTPSPAKAREQLTNPQQPAKKPVEIEVRSNQLVITSDDKELLETLSNLVRDSTSSIPDEFKVIRLKKSVSAEDAAKAMTEIFNGPQQKQQRQDWWVPGVPNAGRIRVVAEKSSNSVVVIKSSPIDLLTIERLLGEHIDRGNNNQAVRPDEKGTKPPPKQPKTFELRLQTIKYSDGKQPEIGFYLDRYYPEFDDRGVPRGLLAAKDLEVLIDGKKGKITDLSPGDKVTVQLSPDNKIITRIELSLMTMKTRLGEWEKQAEALRLRIQQLEKFK